jgi:deoxyribodipyrimidine photo-lyase
LETTSHQPAALVWFRRDLRVEDQPAFAAAVRNGRRVIPVFIWSPSEESPWSCGDASCWWLHHSLQDFRTVLKDLGLNLILRHGPAHSALDLLLKETGASEVYWNRLYDPLLVSLDRQIESALRAKGIKPYVFNGSLLFEPWQLLRAEGSPYKVFTPFWNNLMAQKMPPIDSVHRCPVLGPRRWPTSLAINELKLLPQIDWTGGLRKEWKPGSRNALKIMAQFLRGAISEYRGERDRPDHRGTSRLSPYLHFGEISPRQIWHASKDKRNAQSFLRQIAWREFAHHLLYYFPETTAEPMRREYAGFPWVQSSSRLRAWQKGRTGYPIVDAGMRELWTTGWMHNRVRMVAASFLVKHLLISWQAGAKWFWDTLVDGDLANNTMGWQWVAGCGADAAPYFRIFNPVLQGEKFDPDGTYVRQWVPELSRMPANWIHKPWDCPEHVLSAAGVVLGKNYPKPIVDHAAARRRALLAYERMKTSVKRIAGRR